MSELAESARDVGEPDRQFELIEGSQEPFFDLVGQAPSSIDEADQANNPNDAPNDLSDDSNDDQDSEFTPEELWENEGFRLVAIMRSQLKSPVPLTIVDDELIPRDKWPDIPFKLTPVELETFRNNWGARGANATTAFSILKKRFGFSIEKNDKYTPMRSFLSADEFLNGSTTIGTKLYKRAELLDPRLSIPVLEAVLREQNDPVAQLIDKLQPQLEGILKEGEFNLMANDVLLAAKDLLIRRVYIEFGKQLRAWAKAIDDLEEPNPEIGPTPILEPFVSVDLVPDDNDQDSANDTE